MARPKSLLALIVLAILACALFWPRDGASQPVEPGAAIEPTPDASRGIVSPARADTPMREPIGELAPAHAAARIMLRVVDSLGTPVADARAFAAAHRDRWIDAEHAIARSASDGVLAIPIGFTAHRVAVGKPGYLSRVVDLHLGRRADLVVLETGLKREVYCRDGAGAPIAGVFVAFSALTITEELADRVRPNGTPGWVQGHIQFGTTDSAGKTLVSGLPLRLPNNYLSSAYRKDGFCFRVERASPTATESAEFATGCPIFGAQVRIASDSLVSWSADIPQEVDTSLDYGALSRARKKWKANANIVLAGACLTGGEATASARVQLVLEHRGVHTIEVPYLPYERVTPKTVDVSDVPEIADRARLTVRLLAPDGSDLVWPDEGYLYVAKAGVRVAGIGRGLSINIKPDKPFWLPAGEYVLGSRHNLFKKVLPDQKIRLAAGESRLWEVHARSRLVCVPVTIREQGGAICDRPRFLINTPLGRSFFQSASGKTALFLPEGQTRLRVAPPGCELIDETILVAVGMAPLELETRLK